MERKTIKLGQIKAGPDDGLEPGQMRAYASIFDNTDSYGDIVRKGAFAKTLAAWGDLKGKRAMPLLYGHNMSDPNMNVGTVLEAEEDDRGLKILAQFDDDATAQKVYRLVKAGRIAELSFAYDAVKWAHVEDGSDEANKGAYRELQEVKLYECSVVPVGANPATEVLTIKAAAEEMTAVTDAVKAGRILSKSNEERIREALAGIDTARSALESVLPDDDEDGDGDGEDTDDADKGAVSSDVTRGESSTDEATPPGDSGPAGKAGPGDVTDPLVYALKLLELGS